MNREPVAGGYVGQYEGDAPADPSETMYQIPRPSEPLNMDERETLAQLLTRYHIQEYAQKGKWSTAFFEAIEAVVGDCQSIRHDDSRLPHDNAR